MKNKNGFTLVEILAVIVILAILLLIAGTTVGPLMEQSKKKALSTEGLQLSQAGLAAYKVEMEDGSFGSEDNVCFSIRYLCDNGYFSKGCTNKDKYSGSVLVIYNSAEEDYNTVFWIGNGTYAYEGINSIYDTEGENAIAIDETSYDCTTASENTTDVIASVLGTEDYLPSPEPSPEPSPSPAPAPAAPSRSPEYRIAPQPAPKQVITPPIICAGNECKLKVE